MYQRLIDYHRNRDTLRSELGSLEENRAWTRTEGRQLQEQVGKLTATTVLDGTMTLPEALLFSPIRCNGAMGRGLWDRLQGALVGQ